MANINLRFCKDCVHFNKQGLCTVSKIPNLVTGDKYRKADFERLDGVGICGTGAAKFKSGTFTTEGEKEKAAEKKKKAAGAA